MSTQMTDQEREVQTFDFNKWLLIAAPIEITWEAILAEIGPECVMPDGTPLPLKLEAWPGGRWYRDLGNGAGHFWGHVQVIKPPKLLEICGPMAMSYPAVNHIQYRLTAEDKGTHLKLNHRAIGLIPAEHRDGMPEGLEFWLGRIRELAEGKARGKK